MNDLLRIDPIHTVVLTVNMQHDVQTAAELNEKLGGV